MGIEEVKNFLRVDFEDDDTYIALLMEAAREYIAGAVGQFDDTSARHKLLMLMLIASMYENRQYTIEKGDDKQAYAIRTMVLQLQLEGFKDGQ